MDCAKAFLDHHNKQVVAGAIFALTALKVELALTRTNALKLCKKTGIGYFRDLSVEKQIVSSPVASTQSGCLWTGEFGSLEIHLREQCNFVELKCEFSDVGCTARLPKAEMPAHMKDFCSQHMQLMYSFMMK